MYFIIIKTNNELIVRFHQFKSTQKQKKTPTSKQVEKKTKRELKSYKTGRQQKYEKIKKN